MNRKGSAPTMKDVALEAGVALGTVSKVFNGIPVGESYRIKVEQAAKKLGYQVNSYARGLRASKTNSVAVIMPTLLHPFFAQLTNSVVDQLNRRGCRAILSITDYDPEAEQKCIDMVRQNRVDGIIALTYNNNLIIDETFPFVSFDRFFGQNVPCVTCDNYGGGQLAAKKLNELGCKKLLFFRIGSDITAEPDKRGAGFENYCRMMGLDFYSLRLTDADGIEPFLRFLEEHMGGDEPEFDGIFCSTDKTALQCLWKLREMGIKVPEQVQLIGFDGVQVFENLGRYCSTIVQPIEKLAEAAVNTLLSENLSSLPPLMCLPVSYAPGGTTRDS